MSDARRDAFRKRADAVRERLLAEWNDAPRRTHSLDAREYDAPADPGAVFSHTAVCFVVRDGRVLVIRDAKHPLDREPPGGKAEPGERPAETAEREVREETGVDCEIRELLATDTLEFDYGEAVIPIEQAVFVAAFTGGVLDAEDGIEAEWVSGDGLDGVQYADRLRERGQYL